MNEIKNYSDVELYKKKKDKNKQKKKAQSDV